MTYQMIIILVLLGVSMLSGLIQKIREQQEINRQRRERQQKSEQAQGAGRARVESDDDGARRSPAELQDLAERRRAQLRELRQRQQGQSQQGEPQRSAGAQRTGSPQRRPQRTPSRSQTLTRAPGRGGAQTGSAPSGQQSRQMPTQPIARRDERPQTVTRGRGERYQQPTSRPNRSQRTPDQHEQHQDPKVLLAEQRAVEWANAHQTPHAKRRAWSSGAYALTGRLRKGSPALNVRNLDQSQWRRAIVLSEALGSPVGLRDMPPS